MKQCLTTWLALALALAMAGCSVEQPADTSDPKASMAWIRSTLKKAGKTGSAETRIQLLRRAYGHSGQLKKTHPETLSKHADPLRNVPQQVYGLSIKTQDLDSFEWALDQGAELNTGYFELIEFWGMGSGWRDFILARRPEALPVFMNQAVDGYNVRFFEKHAGAFKATGFKVKSPLETTEFNVRFCRFLADQIADALKDNDSEKIEFLIDHTPEFADVVYIDWKTKDCMRALGDHVFQKQANEALACKLVELGYEYNRIDLADTPFGTAFTDALRANPDYAIRALKLNEWIGALSDANAAFLLTLPDEALDSLHKLHVDEAIESCMGNGHSAGALRFIQLRAKRNPLNRGDYTELINWALQYGNEAVFNYVMEHSEEMDLFSIDFTLLAKSQALFETFAPQIMDKIYRTMDTHPRNDGTTFGRINQVFASPNEKAGLYLVQKYDLSKAWVMVTKGRTLLMDVCHAGNLEAARFLIERRGADIQAETGYSELEISIFGSNRPTEGKLSPIFFAAKGGDSELIEYLKSKGANVNARSNFGTTPLMHAVTAGHLEAVKTLVDLHANVNIRMNPSLNQIDLRAIGSYDEISNAYRRARTGGNGQIIELLKNAGARP